MQQPELNLHLGRLQVYIDWQCEAPSPGSEPSLFQHNSGGPLLSGVVAAM